MLMDSHQTVIIDGYNLIGRVPALASRLGGQGSAAGLDGARSYLLGWLRRYQSARRRRVVLVLDGPRAGRSDFGPVEVRYAVSADRAVAALAEPGAMVVTSDLAVAAEARARGASVLPSEDFWAALLRNDTPARKGGPRAPRQPALLRNKDDDDLPRSGPRRGNPRRRSKADRRRERERQELMRRV
jgi:predicted RNA-binding protein with PIN domain